MPRRYKPELDHRPLRWGKVRHDSHGKDQYRGRSHEDDGKQVADQAADVETLVGGLMQSAGKIRSAFGACGVELQDDDLEPLIDRLQVIMVRFVAECRAHPLRTPAQLLPTVKAVQQDPGAFLERMEAYSPEGVAIVYQQYRKLFPGKGDLAAFEAGAGPAPDKDDIKRAAEAAVLMLEQEAELQGRGRPKRERVERLARTLGRQFTGLGGHLRRTVHDGESGPFLAFLEAVVGPARALVSVTGYSLTPATMVRFPRE